MTTLSRRGMLGGMAAGAACGSFVTNASVQAAAPITGKQAPGFYRYKVGDYEVTMISDGTLNLPVAAIRNAGADEVNAALEAAYLPKGTLTTPYNATLINTGSKLVLIDTGNGSGRAPTVGQLPTNLAAAGIDPKTIDTVVISHFHGDHIGGLMSADGALLFPNAEIKVPTAELAYWMDDGEMSRAPEGLKGAFNNARRIFGAIKTKPTPYEAGNEVAPGITAVATPGHTPGHTSYVVSSGNGKLFVQVDVTAVTALLIVHRPDWQIGGDIDGPKAVETRRKVYDMLVAERMPLTGFHLPFPGVGYIEKSGAGYRMTPALWNSTL